MQNSQNSTLHNFTETAIEEFTYDWLEKNDPDNFILGKLCSCCAHLEGLGYGIMRASIIHPNIQNLVIRNRNNEIVAKSTLFVNPNEGYGVFNNIEVAEEINQKDLPLIYQKYILGVRAFAEAYNKEHKDIPLRILNVGMNLNDLVKELKINAKEADTLLKAINYEQYCKNGIGHSSDSNTSQYTVWEKE